MTPCCFFACFLPLPLPMDLNADLHARLLRLLSDQAGRHFQGLAQASRWHRHRLSQAQARRLRNLDVAFHVLRHVTRPSVEAFFLDIQGVVDLSSTGSPSLLGPVVYHIASDGESTGDGDSDSSEDTTRASSASSGAQTTTDLANSIVSGDPETLVHVAVHNAAVSIYDALQPRFAKFSELHADALVPITAPTPLRDQCVSPLAAASGVASDQCSLSCCSSRSLAATPVLPLLDEVFLRHCAAVDALLTSLDAAAASGVLLPAAHDLPARAPGDGACTPHDLNDADPTLLPVTTSRDAVDHALIAHVHAQLERLDDHVADTWEPLDICIDQRDMIPLFVGDYFVEYNLNEFYKFVMAKVGTTQGSGTAEACNSSSRLA
eukprot:CAMPEP_0117500888 /NCGR_PEP_ID=MMETSP0784-20121206/23010_1 /TAXON_ID=39447 /ORGANISM="" /LENGTH=377 /DNA_ID=CAMNT_0005296115 /DNA_START=49 /DNA_END=1179 /DNA_ORIENTATION=+